MYYGVAIKEHIRDMINIVCRVLGNGENDTAHILISGTIAVETNYGTYLDPTPFRAGSGLCQFDRIGFDNVKEKVLGYHKDWNNLLVTEFGINLEYITYDMIEYNPLLSIIFCRLYYKLIKEPIPKNILDISKYWKKYYNTECGKGTSFKFLEKYKVYYND